LDKSDKNKIDAQKMLRFPFLCGTSDGTTSNGRRMEMAPRREKRPEKDTGRLIPEVFTIYFLKVE